MRHKVWQGWLRLLPTAGALALATVAAGLAGVLPATAARAGTAGTQASSRAAAPVAAASEMALFTAAAREFGVPSRLLLAIGYAESRWQDPGRGPSAAGGYGLMGLDARTFRAVDGRTGAPRTVSLVRTHDTLQDAARLLHVTVGSLQTSNRQNVRGAAAVLASYARGLNHGSLPASLNGWYGAVAAYSGSTRSQAAGLYADQVFAALRSGAAETLPDGERMRLPATAGLRPDRGALSELGLKPEAASSQPVDCPAVLHCTFIPAAYAEDPGGDPGNYGDYDLASRPQDLAINSIVIHDTEESYADTISTFTNPASYVSANYVINTNGQVTEMVRPQDVAWAVGDWYYNTHSVSIEHVGFAAQGAQWYTPAMYRASAILVRYLSRRYGVPLDRTHIVGHENIPGPTDYYTAINHWDPGPFWNWNRYMAMLHGWSARAALAQAGTRRRDGQRVVTIYPNFATNQPTVTDCQSGTCVTLPRQGANFVYLHTAPSSSAPLLSDPLLHPNGAAGTTVDSDWGDKATTGEQYVLAGRQGNWTGIWFGGQVGWFYNPPGSGQTAYYRGAWVVTPKPGMSSVPLYGSAFPEASAYPSVVPVRANDPLTYTIPAGQAYVTSGMVPDDFYYAVTYNSSKPDDHTVITGKTKYYEITYNHRFFYVKAADVRLEHLG